jgi:hypothetical protein
MSPKDQAAVSLGHKGGKATARNRTAEERAEAARKAVEARWAKLRETVNDIAERSKALEKRATRKAKQKKDAK